MTGSEVAVSGAGVPTSSTEASAWHRWCRLCSKEHPDNVNVFFRDCGQTWTTMLAVAIGKYFWVNIKMDDELSNALCKECYTLVEDLIEFSDRVNRVQTLFSKLQQAGPDANVDYNELRRECGLLTDEWKHIASKDASVEPPVEKVEENAVDYIVDEMVESIDEDAEIMADLAESELIQNEEEENAYETYVENDETMEETYVEQEAAVEHETHSDDTQSELEPKPIVDYVDSDATATVNEANAKQITENSAESSDQGPCENQMADNEDIAKKEDKQFQCTSCSKRFKDQMDCKRHMAIFHGLVPTDKHSLECKRCHTFFATDNQLAAHYRTHLPSKDKTENACTYCPKLFTTAGALKRHIMCIHENVKPYICDCCGKGMKTITALNEHKLVHTDECPFECSVCHRRFKNKARLKIHSDTHTNNNYSCNICGLKLNTRRTLNMHQLVHTDAKQYKCDVCGAAFKRGKTLKAHLILHTGIRPYKCNFCGKDFSNGSNCRMHKRKTHPKELAEEEARGVMRSTLLPMITELTEASKRVKIPAKASTAVMRIKIPEETTDTTNDNMSDDQLDQVADDEMLYEIVEECP